MKFIKKIILTFVVSALFSYSWVFAAWIDHFEVKFNTDSAKAWEAVDLSIQAMDKNNAAVLDYKWTILIFSETDPETQLPNNLSENTYTFTAVDQWKIKFENGVVFKSAWLQDINIYDLNDDSIFWIWQITISKATTPTSLDISIISPENGLTIWKNSINITWLTKKNHQVKILVNWKEVFNTTSNDQWVFEKTIEKLTDWANTFKASVLDANLKVIGESSIVKLKVEQSNLTIKNIKVTPPQVDPEGDYEIEIIATPKMPEVSIIIDDILNKLIETKPGVYIAKLKAPKDSKIYKIDSKIKDELWREKIELGAASLTVNEVVFAAATEVAVISTGAITKECIDKDIKIKWLKLVELKTKSILTWDKVEWVDWYNVYKKLENWVLELITNVKESKFEVDIVGGKIKYDYFVVKAVSKNTCWALYEWSLSDATKVKTGPEVIILIIISLLVAWFVFISKRKNA